MVPGTYPGTASAGGYRLGLAAVRSDVLAVCELRDQVFRIEGGARTPGPEGFDIDDFDDICDHLVVWWSPDGIRPEIPVATYRLLPPGQNHRRPRHAGLYGSGEFDLRPLDGLLEWTVEAGRACVHPDHRSATAISLLWRGIARYMAGAGHRYLLGCASFHVEDGGRAAAAFADLAALGHRAPTALHCTPRRPFPMAGIPAASRAEVPPLVRGYLRLGAQVCGAPAWDEDFGTADFLMLLDLQQTDQRYLRRFLGPIR
ncbi:GNAT family N-acetyltransferase [Nakamurella alba]